MTAVSLGSVATVVKVPSWPASAWARLSGSGSGDGPAGAGAGPAGMRKKCSHCGVSANPARPWWRRGSSALPSWQK